MKIEALETRWQWQLQRMGLIPDPAVFQGVVAAYTSQDRSYHTLDHLAQVFSMLDELHASDAVELAAWFHDVVYDPRAQDNEERSADWAEVHLRSLHLPETAIAHVTRLILTTKHHQAEDLDSAILLDADLSILGADSAHYYDYAAAIRRECAWVSEAEYRTRRRQVLETFLRRDRIFFTPLMFEQREQQARINLQTEIAALQD